MVTLKEDSFYLVIYWMINKLKLKGANLQVFALIYSFCNDNKNEFYGSLDYMSEATGYTKQSVIDAIKALVEKRYIIKKEKKINGVTTNTYKINLQVVKKIKKGSQNILTRQSNNLTRVVKKFELGSQISLPNNTIENTLNNTIENTEREYGTFSNVLLTPDEYADLKNQFSDYESKINYLSQYLKSSGKEYADHYATIIKWANEDTVKEIKNKQNKNPERLNGESSFDLDKIMKNARNNTEIKY